MLLPSRPAPDLLAGHWQLLGRLGAVPRALVWDNEAAVGSWGGGQPKLTEDYVGTLGIRVASISCSDAAPAVPCGLRPACRPCGTQLPQPEKSGPLTGRETQRQLSRRCERRATRLAPGGASRSIYLMIRAPSARGNRLPSYALTLFQAVYVISPALVMGPHPVLRTRTLSIPTAVPGPSL